MLFIKHHKIKQGKSTRPWEERGDVVKGHNSIKLGHVD